MEYAAILSPLDVITMSPAIPIVQCCNVNKSCVIFNITVEDWFQIVNNENIFNLKINLNVIMSRVDGIQLSIQTGPSLEASL